MTTNISDAFSKIFGNANFLILEDTLLLRAWIVHELRELGVKGSIHESGTLAGAKDLVTTEKVDFIISDWNLPDGTGQNFLEFVKKNPALVSIPFLMWTTVNDTKKVIEAIALGAGEYLLKPCKKEDLENKLISLWKKHQSKHK